MSHDAVSDYLQRDKLTPRSLWERVSPLLKDSPAAYLLVDDSVQNKQYSRQIELVKRHYSGAEHGLVRGIFDDYLRAELRHPHIPAFSNP